MIDVRTGHVDAESTWGNMPNECIFEFMPREMLWRSQTSAHARGSGIIALRELPTL